MWAGQLCAGLARRLCCRCGLLPWQRREAGLLLLCGDFQPLALSDTAPERKTKGGRKKRDATRPEDLSLEFKPRPQSTTPTPANKTTAAVTRSKKKKKKKREMRRDARATVPFSGSSGPSLKTVVPRELAETRRRRQRRST